MSSPVPRRYVTTGEAAKALGVHRSTLQRAVERGWLRPHLVTPGGHYRWDLKRLREEVRELYRRQREEGE